MCAFVFFSYRSFIFLLFRPTFNILYENSKKKNKKKENQQKESNNRRKKDNNNNNVYDTCNNEIRLLSQ